jgi:predicted RND superfamily exporter protein
MENIYLSLINKYTNVTLLFLLIIICFFAYSSKNFQLDASSDTLILEQDEDLKKYRKVIDDYGSSDFLIVTFSDKNKILTDKNLEQIKLFVDEVIKFKWVESVQSIFDVPLLEVKNQSLTDLIDEILTIESSVVNLDDAEKELLNSPIFKNLIISEDATSTGVLVNFKKNSTYEFLIKERDRLKSINKPSKDDLDTLSEVLKEYEIIKKNFDQERHNNINEIRKTINDFSANDLKIHLGGVSMIADDTITFVKNDIFIFGIGALIFILIVLFIVFKNPLWMFACISNCIASLIIMIGTVSLMQWKVTVISSNFIMLILILSLSMTVHIVVRYKQFLIQGIEKSREEALILTIRNMYKPCLFAALTTVFAFATLYSSGIKPVMDFGMMMCVGLVITYITSFTFLPILIFFLKLSLPSHLSSKHADNFFTSIVLKYPNILLICFIMIFCLGLYGTTKLKVENSFIDYFKKDTEIYKGMKLIDDKLGGTTPLDIIIDFNTETNNLEMESVEEEFLDFGIEYDPEDYWFTREKIDTIKKIHDHLEKYPFAGKVLSLASVVRTAEKLNLNNEFDTLELSVLYKKLPNELKNQIIKPYVLISEDQARITMRIIDTHPELVRENFVSDLNDFFNENFSDKKINVSITGILILYNNMLQSLFDSQIKTLSIVLMGIFFMLFFLFRSFKIAFAAIMPNVIACFVILGSMGLLSIPLDLMTITIAAITIGIAVDNCIHYIYRYREYLTITGKHDETVIKCNETVGQAIKNTSYTIIAGFSILIISNFYPTIYFGLFTALAMIVALCGSLTLLPVILKKLITV